MRTVIQIGCRTAEVEENDRETRYFYYRDDGTLESVSRHFMVVRVRATQKTEYPGPGLPAIVHDTYCGRCMCKLWTGGVNDCHCACHDPSNVFTADELAAVGILSASFGQ